MATPTTWLRLTHWLHRGDNPLRRRSDRIEAWLLPTAIAGFVALSPVVAGAAALWVRADNSAARQAESSWHPVHAVLLRSAPGPEMSDGGANSWLVWTLARWTANGRRHVGQVPVPARTTAGSTAEVWVDLVGNVRLPPLTPAQVRSHVVAVASVAVGGLAAALAGLALAARRLLDRRRFASWGIAWLSVGPSWSRQA